MKLLKTIVEELGATSATIMLPNEAEQHLYCYDSFNMPPEWVGIKNPYDNHTNKGNVHVYKTTESVIDNGFSDMFYGHYIESVMIVPIVKDHDVIGTLEIIHSQKGKNFSNNDFEKAMDFSKQLKIE